MHRLLLLLTTSLLALCLQAAPSEKPLTAKTENPQVPLQARLARAKTPADSVAILYHLWDCSSRTQQPAWGRMLIEAAQHAHDYAAILDILRQLSVLYSRSDSVMNELADMAAQLPPSVDRRVTELFIAQQLLATQATNMDEQQRSQRVAALMNGYTHPGKKDDVYDQISRLFSISTILGQATQGQLYVETLERLGSLVASLPAEGAPLRSQYYTALANIYTNNDRPADAIKADRRLLQVIDSLEGYYRSRGRVYRNMAPNRYNCYRRMLQNYRALTPAQAADLYAKVQTLVASDPDVKANETATPRAEASALMAAGRYREAIPVLKSLLAAPRLNMNLRRQLLRELRIAAENTGDRATLLEALMQYTALIDTFDSLRTADNLSELSIRYEVSRLRTEKQEADSAAAEKERIHQRTLLTLLISACGLLALLMALTLRYLTRLKRRLHQMQVEKETR